MGAIHSLPYILTVIAVSTPLGLLAGCGVVFALNKMPASWLTDYGEEPSSEVASHGRQRIPGMPWKYIFSAAFVVVSIYLGMKNPQLGLSTLIVLWTLLLISLADGKYGIIPDQLCVLLAGVALGFIPFHKDFTDILWGGLLGFGTIVALAFMGKMIWRRETIGFGDAKLCGALGMILGFYGVAMVMIGGTLMAGVYAAFALVSKRVGKYDEKPLGPFLAAAAAVYMIVIM